MPVAGSSRYRQQGRASAAAILRKCCTARLGSMGTVAVHHLLGYLALLGCSTRSIALCLHRCLRHYQCRKRRGNAQLQASGRKSVSLDAIRKVPLLAHGVSLSRSFLQSLCVLGYCLFPLDVAAFIATFVRILWIRLPICLLCFGWSVFGTWLSPNHRDIVLI